MNSRRYSKTLKKADLISINKLLEDENSILKKEISNLTSLLRSQEERHQTETNFLVTENESLAQANSQLIKTTVELQEALKLLRSAYPDQVTKKESIPKVCLSSRCLKNKENYEETSRSCKSLKKNQISPLRSGLLQDSKKLLALMNKMKRMQKY